MATHFEYRRSSRSEAIWTALWGGSLLALVSVLIFVTAVYRDRTGGQLFTLIVAIAGTMFGLALCYHVIANWLVNQDFVFRIDDSGIEQIVPVCGGSESFQIPAKQLHYVISVFSDGSRDLLFSTATANDLK